jgi:hypothetical protein
MENIKTIAKDLNDKHGRSMTWPEAVLYIENNKLWNGPVNDLYANAAKIYSESVRLEERKKVVDEVENEFELRKYRVTDSEGRECDIDCILESLKQQP